MQLVLGAIARTAAQLCDANDALILRVDGDRFQLVARHGVLPTAIPVGSVYPHSRDSVVGRAVLDRRTIQIRDMAKAVKTEFPGSAPAQQAAGTRTLLVTPLVRDGVSVGAIAIRRTTFRPFTAGQIALLKTFADQAPAGTGHHRPQRRARVWSRRRGPQSRRG